MFRLLAIFSILFKGIIFGNTPVTTPKEHKIGLCVVATGKYDKLAQSMVNSARIHFCKNHRVTFFVFTDGEITPAPDVIRIEQARLGWPYDTMKRFEVYEKHQDLFKDLDYVFAVDADMLFVAPVGDEILSDRVATQHPAFVGKRGTYERNRLSRAYVGKKEGTSYFAGGFYGGKKAEFLKLIRTNRENVDADTAHGLIAKWHDESHLNRYFIDHPPTRVLDPSYCYPESWQMPYQKKLVALDKNHGEMRR